MACQEHPNYGGLRSPRTDCKGCWDHYNLLKGNSDVKQEIVQKDKVENETKKKEVREEKIQIETNLTNGELGNKEPVIEPVKLPKDTEKLIEERVSQLVKEILEKKLVNARIQVSNLLDIQYDHLFVSDDIYSIQLAKKLTDEEGWEYVKHSYPLEKYGVINRDYTVFKRIVKVGNIPKPNFEDEKVLRKYNAKTQKGEKK